MSAKQDNSQPTGFKIIIREMWSQRNGKRCIGYWEAKDSAGNVCIRPTAEEAVKGVREMYWKEVSKKFRE